MKTTPPSSRLLFVVLFASAVGFALPGCSGDSANFAEPSNSSDDNNGDASMTPGPFFDGGQMGNKTTGDACSRNVECRNSRCARTVDFPGGYCTTPNCNQQGKSCSGEDAVCVDNGNQPDVCLDGCTTQEDCRQGYECRSHPDASTKVCVKAGSNPGDGYTVGGDDGSPTGAGCGSDAACEGGACVAADGFTGGYCSSVGCTPGSCSGNAACVTNNLGPNICMKTCSSSADCRSGYTCKSSSSAGQNVCAPTGTDPDDGYDGVRKPGAGDPGSSCALDSECKGGRCLRSSPFGDGYCTTSGCRPAGSSTGCTGSGGVCIANSKGPNICLSKCSGDDECRDGYVCKSASSAGGKRVCVPSGTNPDDGYDVGEGPNTGGGCQDNSDCGSGVCIQSNDFDGGYCTEPDCDENQSDSCKGNATCLDNEQGPNVCLQKCSGNGDCRSGYKCKKLSSGKKACVPKGTDPDNGYDVGDGWDGYTGDDCGSDSDCVKGTCVQTPQFPDGYCSTLHCDSDDDCSSEDAECKQHRQGTDMCMKDCDGCRSGYQCEDSVCVPDGSTLNSGFAPTRYDLGFLCLPERTGWGSLGSKWTFKFKIDRDTESYAIVPVVTQGTVKALELDTPRRSIDIAHGYRHHNDKWGVSDGQGALYGGSYSAISFAWPVIVPYAPQFSNYVEDGAHTLEVTSSTERPCMYVVEKDQIQGSEIDLNIYVVSNDYSASGLENDSDWSTVMSEAESLLQNGDLSFGDVEYNRVSTSTVNQFAVTTSYEDLFKLTGEGERTGSDMDDYLSIDVMVVDDIKIQKEGGEVHPLGWVGNLPGAVGLHGNPRNGIVINTRDLGQTNEAIGYALAERLGHFLGLRNTTETVHNTSDGQEMANNFGTTDPINDTPVCQDIDDKTDKEDTGNNNNNPPNQNQENLSDCPDYENLMFPSIPPSTADFTPKLTDDQEQALEANPLVK